ncbi:hypothetical protein A3C32_00070 [Candidatus Daviesbacteria bacterium RIFCSPHIGHO2_02_FULL_41_14]|uniref:Cell division protein FtsL n=1 Tax=Candidatus Daviesbacteria bacterium RIFCSPLOWO2_01_FULL_40_24 TaxID=1797787 RepID=A0A1F5MIP5_9BACT|nr:MAG: hypothetical protein A2780_00730 [Candidatus Daviesbacteria bacterium RIFCSPHIGHO2_01_FULL_41_45]OGE34077.1 MAG: hypothetical protein A3C32_00070 [Candidatus Daviesbacteria bacterium RIFCSPHIGHO2_02_FULL_41_14]OGE65232.1 MAG: hypothetical protein A3B49_02265 [Candidatus Daviesbacteria bacterium RIFCSPLOWO2_01_FULL_40_24]
MIKKGTIVLVTLLILGILYGITQQINQSLGARGRLKNQAQEVAKLESENQQLQEELNRVKSVEFVEKVARNNLNLARNNETIFIISDEAIAKTLQGSKVEETNLPNWQGWLRLFLN